ncbi:L-arabinose isomerase [Microlunatus spumicola]|uniref:L-arabinose isomerase n=1 Tax=Microlunatus spumicola TaxID=81499 RepID=A0ABP6XMB2_9ACTN
MPSSTPTVWFLTGSQGLYGPEIVAQVEQQSQEVVRLLDSSDALPVKVEWKPVLTDSNAIHRLVLAANADPDCVGLIAWMHTFSPAKMWINGLDALQTPLLHLHTQANVSLPWSEIDMDFMNLNQAAHGDREFGYIQTRLGVHRKTVVGHVSDPAVQRRVADWQRAALGVAAVRSLKLARFGDNMRDVAVTEGDKVEAQRTFGVSVNAYGVNALVAAVDAVAESEVDALIETYGELYEIAPELLPGAERHESLRYGAKIEAGLRAFLVEGGFGAFTTNFEDLGGLRQLPGLAVQRLMAEGYGFGGEGDWKTSVMLHTIKAMSVGLPQGTSFMEDYTYHLGPGPQKILGSHMLEVCPSIAAAKPRIEIHPLGIGDREDPVRLVFDAAPGSGVVVGICDLGDRFRLVLNEIEVTVPDQPLPKLPVARAVWEPLPDLPTSAECWIAAGGPHHSVLSSAVGTEVLDDFAEMLGVELLVIDGDTRPRTFTQEIRWNQAYHRLAAGF